ncbi:hypothetical protein HMPREF0860_0121 [Treponema socranskii subsp. socranskii VPI DR56BR1116 = ATCC 35536]|uniref:Lipoprotein n=1 Tax=Treponema socranskii subsp. socranskii VPI DR56BR1116 = ATCC 35536 TaxID=1125725 RepID=U2MLM0_TRESO|nr:hypothetical protein [Treponema socranskii]ERF61564.1 hypothetical protein HMPREF1325_2368 [Treponema socranskii subsp. socranskii VPI DR56BR1116 = ATCC 35536]ERK02545.1 hypothetical protein HMPREF0860_0121 [Treponema socranskii subsp. socranskii VPI DR56BR1116 = ATCC 35536]
MKKISILFALILLGTGIASCKNPLDRTEAVTFSLPSWPPDECAEFPPLAYWEIRYAGGAQAECVIRLEAGVKNVTLEAAADRPLTVIAQPISRHGETAALFFKPAGCIWPHERKLGWESGFAAFVCMRLYSSNEAANGAYLATFNWKKLCDALAEKSADTEHPYDPWKADTETVCTAIAEHSFGASLLSMKKTALITISELEQKTREIGVPQSDGTEAGEHQIHTGEGAAHALFIPQYIPLYRTHRRTGKTLLKKAGVTSFLYTIQSIAAVQYRADGFPALAISAVPLYTGEQ